MQKFIRVTAIIAVVLVALSFLLLLISIPFQQTIAAKVFGSPHDAVSIMPVVPWVTVTNCIWLLGCAILAVVFGGNKKGGIWLEILVFAAVALVLPMMTALLGNVQNVVMAQARGTSYIAANAVANQIASYCMAPGNLGQSLILTVCGMSIVYKRMSKKLAKVTE